MAVARVTSKQQQDRQQQELVRMRQLQVQNEARNNLNTLNQIKHQRLVEQGKINKDPAMPKPTIPRPEPANPY
jgi:hypothetical protein